VAIIAGVYYNLQSQLPNMHAQIEIHGNLEAFGHSYVTGGLMAG